MVTTLRRVPWTCRWSRFGGSVSAPPSFAPGFVFWFCCDGERLRVLDRDECEACPRWEPDTEHLDAAGEHPAPS